MIDGWRAPWRARCAHAINVVAGWYDACSEMAAAWRRMLRYIRCMDDGRGGWHGRTVAAVSPASVGSCLR